MAGLGTLIRLILRRDRIKLPIWIVSFGVLLLSMVPLLQDVYGSSESLEAMYAAFGANPAGLFMTGPMDGPNFGAFMTIETLLWWGLAIAFMNTLLVVRHTRHNEEIGAQELLLSGQVHRSSGLAAALVVALGANTAAVLLVGSGLMAVDVPWSVSQSWLYALCFGMFGLTWAAIAAVIVQLVESARSANGIMAGLIGVSFVLRGIGDFLGRQGVDGLHHPAWASFLSPFGWMQAVRPLTEPSWTPLLGLVGLTMIMSVCGFILLSRRDVGAGLLPSRKGNLRASALLATPLGLTIYLQKNIFISYFAGVVVMVGTIGALVPQMSDVYNDSDNMREMIQAIGGTGALVPTFMSAMMAILSIIVFAYVIHGLGRARSEESGGHLESLLATRLSRVRWLGLHVTVVLIGGTIMLTVTGFMLALCVNLLSGFSVGVGEYTLAAVSYVPIMVAFSALYLLLFGSKPRVASGFSWLYFGFVAFALWLGPVIRLNQAIANLSIMEHLSAPPAGDVAWRPLMTILAIAICFIAFGFIAFKRRDIG